MNIEEIKNIINIIDNSIQNEPNQNITGGNIIKD